MVEAGEQKSFISFCQFRNS